MYLDLDCTGYVAESSLMKQAGQWFVSQLRFD